MSDAGGGLVFSATTKRGSVLRRLPPESGWRCVAAPVTEGVVGAFRLPEDASPITIEAPSGRAMTLAPGDVMLATAGHRESTRWVVGSIPEAGLMPNETYWILADCGIVGTLLGDSPRQKGHLAPVTCLGAVHDADGLPLSLARFTLPPASPVTTPPPVFLVLGTASEVGKTTAALGLLRALRRSAQERVLALKATGTSSVTELHSYQDLGAWPCLDAVDFGLPTTYPSDRAGIEPFFAGMLAWCLAQPVDAVLIECGGDLLGANVPAFLQVLRGVVAEPRVVLAAADSLAAFGAKSVLAEFGLTPILLTGPCTDTPTIQARTQRLCGIPAINLARGDDLTL
ncbi:MAG: hypothetical protein J0H67_17425 [Rhodospirillales bacterium]|nr:hypothetical protein [Rhodospirillales bacterium]